MRIRIIVLILFCLAGSLFAKEMVNIGALFSLSGKMQMYGRQLRDGALLRVQEQKENYDSLFDYSLRLEDVALNPQLASQAYDRLSRMERCRVFLCNWSPMAKVVAPAANRDGNLTVSVTWNRSIAQRSLAFIHCTQPEDQGKLLVEALDALGIERVAIMSLRQSSFLVAAKAVQAEAKRLGIETVLVKFSPGEVNFRAPLSQLHGFNPEAYVVLAFQPEFQICLKRIREMQSDYVLLTAIETFGSMPILKGYDGCFFTDGNNPTEEFEEYYRDASGQDSVGYAALGYDMAGVVIDTYERVGKMLGRMPNPAEVAMYMRDVSEFDTVFSSLKVDDNGVIQAPCVLKYIENGKAIRIDIDELVRRKAEDEN